MKKVDYLKNLLVRRTTLITALLFCLLSLTTIPTIFGQNARDSKGTDFWLAFPRQYTTSELKFFIASETNTSGTVNIPGIGFSTTFNVVPGSATTVSIPSNAQLTDGLANLGIHIQSEAEVTVYGLNRLQATTDAFLGLPTDILGMEYIVLGYEGGVGYEFAVVGTENGTTVNIAPAGATAYSVTLNQGQTYQRVSNGTSGTIITSDKPVAVFGGNVCANVPSGYSYCDYIVEQIPPTDTWGKNFVTMPLATRLNGDTFRFLAQTNNTQVSVNGTVVATLNRGQFHERIINGPAQITSDQPILVAQYSNGTGYDGVTSDPFMMLVPPYEQFLAKYTVSAPASGFSKNFINVVAPTSDVGNVKLDGTTIPPGSFTAIGSSGFSGAKIEVTPGSHNLSSNLPFGVFVYGFANFDSYGYPGGLSLAPIARVNSVALSPLTGSAKVGEQYCVTANVKDQFDNPLEGIRVDFTITGANSSSGFANTDASGNAEFCYSGANVGSDSVKATVGTINSGTVEVEWKPANTAPVAVEDSYSTNEDNSLNVSAPGVIGNDTDAENNSLTASLVSGPVNGSVTLNPDGSFNYTPNLNFNGTDSFTYKANDGSLDSNTATVTITVNAVNDAPTVSGGSVTRQQGTPGSVSTVATVSDVDNSAGTLTVSVTSLPQGIAVTNFVNNNGTISATVTASCSAAVGNNSVGLKVTDADGAMGTGTLTVNVTAESTPPVIDPINNVTAQLPANSTAVSMPVNFPLPTATDNCGFPVTVTTSPASGSVFPVGTTTVQVTATDQAGNQSTSSFTVTVLYRFQMVYYSDLLLSQQQINQVTAGSNLPVRFSLSGYKGDNPYSQAPTSVQISCSTLQPIGPVQTISRFAPDPYYSSVYDFYQTTWRTQTSWKFTCRRLTLHLNDGSTQSMNFYFK